MTGNSGLRLPPSSGQGRSRKSQRGFFDSDEPSLWREGDGDAVHGHMPQKEVAGRRGDVAFVAEAPEPRVRVGSQERAHDLPSEEGAAQADGLTRRRQPRVRLGATDPAAGGTAGGDGLSAGAPARGAEMPTPVRLLVAPSPGSGPGKMGGGVREGGTQPAAGS